ncbi:hypothetical protein [Leifsonia sp. P73]|uniref:hypothetical protein n=1 Tax=Leifsonia sp. P73 TaxID=3423959 RepID=UPI003DA2F667
MTDTDTRGPRARKAALFLTIVVLAVSAVFGAVLIVVGDQANIAGRAWLTLLLVGAFAGAVALDATVSDGPNRWYLPASTITNAVLVAVGLLKLWNGALQPDDTSDALVWAVQFWRFVGVVVLARLALLLTQVYGLRFVTRATSRVSWIGGVVTLALAWATALVLALPAILPAATWPDWWWRLASATTLVAAVAAVIPLLVRAFEAKPAERGGRSTGPELRSYPPYAFPATGDAVQPLRPGAVPPPQQVGAVPLPPQAGAVPDAPQTYAPQHWAQPAETPLPPHSSVHRQPQQPGAAPPQPGADPQAQLVAAPPASSVPPPTASGFPPPQ